MPAVIQVEGPEQPAAHPAQAGLADDDPIGAGDSALEAMIEAKVKALRARGSVAADESTSWLVHDLIEDRTLAAINAAESRQAASMIKPLVMLAFFHETRRGRFIYGDVSTAKFEAMIQRSSNTATNWVIDQLGGPSRVQRVLDDHYGHLFTEALVVEKIAAGGKTYKNQASARDYGRYLRALWHDELPYSAEQKRLLNLPGRDRLYDGAPSIPVGTTVYNKTGSTSQLCGDMGILVSTTRGGKRYAYAIVGVIQKASRTSSYSAWIASRGGVIRTVSDLSYRWLKEQHDLT